MEFFKKYEIPDLKEKEEENSKVKYNKEWLSVDEIQKLFESSRINSRNLLLIKVIYSGALRISEALNSRLEDYRLEKNECYLLLHSQKTDKVNWEKQPIQESIYGDIVRYCKDKGLRSQDYVFQSTHKKKLGYNRAYKIIRDLPESVGINKNITTHTFRRSRASHLLDDEAFELYDVSKFLRHKSILTTMKYLKISKRNLFEKMKEADARIFRKQ